jgi:ubiquinone/menaquinone biosynthesis C-methylase UbiE
MGLAVENSGKEALGGESWHLALFKKSVLKQRKFRELTQAVGKTDGLRCLDLGSDNGVISYLLREHGGDWASADLTAQAVDSIRSLVGRDVHLIEGEVMPFADDEFDVVVVVDMLEHVEDDQSFLKEMGRILKPTGLLVLNVPTLKHYSPLRGFRYLIGQTDEAHGHLRPGYSKKQLKLLSESEFGFVHSHTYSRFFSELIDTAIVFAVSLLSPGSHGGSEEGEVSKGLVVTEKEIKKFEKKFKLYSLIYPLLAAFSKLDNLIPFVPGFMTVCSLRKK